MSKVAVAGFMVGLIAIVLFAVGALQLYQKQAAQLAQAGDGIATPLIGGTAVALVVLIMVLLFFFVIGSFKFLQER
jgi:hypothetical protein